jgi:hypothetical protein
VIVCTGKMYNCIRRYLYLALVNSQQFHSLCIACIHTFLRDKYLIFISCAFRFGVIFNMGWLVYGDFKAGFEMGPWWQRLFNGYSITTWIVVFNLGSTGLLVSWLMKYSDNIVKVRLSRLCM